WREDPVRRAVRFRAVGGFAKQGRFEALHLDSITTKSPLDARIACKNCRFVAIVPEHGIGGAFARDRAKHAESRAAANDEPRTVLLQRCGKSAQRLVEPPARCGAGRPRFFFLRRPDETRDHTSAAPCRSIERRVVMKAKVRAQPENRRTLHAAERRRACDLAQTASCRSTLLRADALRYDLQRAHIFSAGANRTACTAKGDQYLRTHGYEAVPHDRFDGLLRRARRQDPARNDAVRGAQPGRQ